MDKKRKLELLSFGDHISMLILIEIQLVGFFLFGLSNLLFQIWFSICIGAWCLYYIISKAIQFRIVNNKQKRGEKDG